MNLKRPYVIVLFVLLAVWLTMPTAAVTQVGGGDLTYTPKNSLPVVFSHQKHLSGKDLTCADCHYQVFEMAKGSYKMDMEKMTKAMFCGKCHDGQKTFGCNEPQKCSICHR